MKRFREDSVKRERRTFTGERRTHRSGEEESRPRRDDRGDFRRPGRSDAERPNRGNSYSGRKDSGRDMYGEPKDAWKESFKAICAECGKTCEVPFRPNNTKPIYCSDCFQKIEHTEKRSEKKRDNDSIMMEQIKEKLDVIERKLDQALKALGFE